MVKTIIQDKQMLFLALFAAFFVGSAITGVFSDYEAEAKKDNNNGNNGCENANPNAKACENNPNTTPTCITCGEKLQVGYAACETLPAIEQNACFHAVIDAHSVCASQTDGGSCPQPPPPDF